MVDCGGLENRWACKGPEGSNPSHPVSFPLVVIGNISDFDSDVQGSNP